MSPQELAETEGAPTTTAREGAFDPEWDDFVASSPHGHLVQTSLWAHVNAEVGWRAVRLAARDGKRIVGGFQMLLRRAPGNRAVGYISKAPLLAAEDPELARDLIRRVHRLAADHRVRLLLVQPPDGADWMTPILAAQGFERSPVQTLPVGTTRIDLSRDLDDILAAMSRRTRYHIRLSGRRGITSREATESDLPEFYRLIMTTARRRDFKEFPFAYFETMWNTLAPRGYLKIFFAELDSEPLSAMLAITFGDTLLVRKAGWCGEHGNIYPNENMHWRAIRWAKENGFRYYDFEGIKQDIAEAHLEGREPETGNFDSFSRFKLGFRGEVVMNPPTRIYIYNRLVRWLYRTVYVRIADSAPMKRFVDRFLGRVG